MKFLSFFLIVLIVIPFNMLSQDELDLISESEMKMAMRQFNNSDYDKNAANEFTGNYDLKYHRFQWNIDPAEHYISGAVTSYFVPVSGDMSEMYFQLSSGFIIDSVIAHGTAQTAVWADDMVHITYDFIIPDNTLDSVTVYYQGTPFGTGFGSFNTAAHSGTPILWTLSEPYGAMDWWPCKQDLNDKIDSIDVIVRTGIEYRVASNGLLVDSIPIGDHTIYHWKHRYAIPAYLIAIAVTNYASYSNWVPMEEGPDLQVLNYVYPEELEFAQSQTEGIVEIMQFYNETFKPYPYRNEKYGHAQFEWGGGMEHTTMSFMVNFGYGLMAHELAHMWFGDDITCGSWVDIWLNEGFATYLTAMNDEYQGHTGSWEGWKFNSINSVTSKTWGSVKVDDTTSVGRIFDSRLTYRKGALLLHMLRWEMGDEDFILALQNYINDENLSYGYARTIQLQEHLEAVSGLDLTEFFSDWYENQGYPSHTIEYSQTGSQVYVKVHQEQSHSSVDFFELTLPLLFLGGGNDSLVKFPLTENDQNFNFQLDFEIQNVVYDPEQWLISKNNSIVLSIDDFSRKLGVKLYPNPVQQSLNVQFAMVPTAQLKYRIIDASGKTVLDGKLQSVLKQSIDTSALSKGNYKLVMESSEGKTVVNFVKAD
jgi:aminopeptidase N